MTRSKISIQASIGVLLGIILFSIGPAYFASAQNYKDSLTSQLQKHLEASDLPGFGVSIVTEDGIQYEKGFGYANIQDKVSFGTLTVENLGSVSKTVVGLALVKAIEDGYFNLDTEINDFLPFKVENPYFKDSPILIRHLAQHTSSILDTKNYGKTYIKADYERGQSNIHEGYLHFIEGHEEYTLADFLFKILSKNGEWYKKKNYLKAKPGTQKEYSNLNAALVAVIIENATKTTFREFTKAKIFDPLKMHHTTWSIEDVDPVNMATTYFPSGNTVPKYALITYPDGGLYSSVSDLSLFLQEIIKAYSGHSAYLAPQWAKLLLPGDDDSDRAFWGIGTTRNIGHGGSDPGVQTDLQFNADTKLGRIILSNVNAEDNDLQWKQYQEIRNILAKFEKKITD